ncbi:Os03g0711650 [Oryza sativa Japonica Group]|uniref:Os03g0711650 protein n=1 Tax=Oryza sativa subsp. japonica TaxID=39947 RepID=C7IZG2_ORYSJ|nr:Os03g0711650 [Oryza sativa Japonica Group]|eukprot:NP_001173612.1 Os03g0711650 [Oryza sativa Japonica Group]
MGKGWRRRRTARETSGRRSWMRRSRGAGLAARSWLAAGEVLAASAPGNRWSRGGGGRGPRVHAAAFVLGDWIRSSAAFVALIEPRPRDSVPIDLFHFIYCLNQATEDRERRRWLSQGSAGGGVAASSGVAVNITTGPMTETEDDMAVAEEEEVVAASAETEEHVQRILLAIDAFTRQVHLSPFIDFAICHSEFFIDR